METLWHGERYALLAHPAMRFERDWEKKLLHALNDCPVENAQAVLTGYLPAQDDPIGAVCPVAAERIDPDGTLCFAHGMPLTLAAHPMPGAFWHPDFFFARAGFIRAMAQGSGTAFLRAMVQGWQCCIRFIIGISARQAQRNLPGLRKMYGKFREMDVPMKRWLKLA